MISHLRHVSTTQAGHKLRGAVVTPEYAAEYVL